MAPPYEFINHRYAANNRKLHGCKLTKDPDTLGMRYYAT